MNRTSEITITSLDIDKPKFDYKFVERNVLAYKEGFSEHLRHTATRYNECFYYFDNDTIIGQSLKYYGEYTQPEIDLLLNFILPHSVVYDIGANIGYHTDAFATKAKLVVAFEPNNKNFELCHYNTHKSGKVVLVNAACSDKNDSGYIEDFDLGKEGNLGELKLSTSGQSCKLIILDEFIEKTKLPNPDVVKIDVEGHEYEVIQGMVKTIENNLPTIFYEHLHGENLEKVSDYLESRAYKQYWFPCRNYTPNNYKRNETNIFGDGGVLNVLAVPFHLDVKTNLPEKIKGESWQQCREKLIKAYEQQQKD